MLQVQASALLGTNGTIWVTFDYLGVTYSLCRNRVGPRALRDAMMVGVAGAPRAGSPERCPALPDPIMSPITSPITSARGERLLSRHFLALVASTLLLFLAIGMTLPVLPRMVVDRLHGGELAVGVVVGCFALSAVAARFWTGRLGHRFGLRLLMLSGAVLGGVTFAGYGLVPDPFTLVVLRLVGGAGQALFFVGAVTLMMDLVPESRRSQAVSYFSVAPWLGIGFGPALGERVFDATGYGTVFGVAGGLGAGAAVIALFLPDLRSSQEEPPPAGFSRIALGPGIVLGLGLLGTVGFAAFLPLYALQIGADGTQYVFLAYGMVILLTRLLGGGLPDRWGTARTGTAATLLLALGLAMIAAHPSEPALYGGTVLLGLGTGLNYPALLSLTIDRATDEERATAISTFTMFLDLPQGIGGALLGQVAAVGGYRVSFVAGAMFALAALVVFRLFVLRPGSRLGPVPVLPVGDGAAALGEGEGEGEGGSMAAPPAKVRDVAVPELE